MSTFERILAGFRQVVRVKPTYGHYDYSMIGHPGSRSGVDEARLVRYERVVRECEPLLGRPLGALEICLRGKGHPPTYFRIRLGDVEAVDPELYEDLRRSLIPYGDPGFGFIVPNPAPPDLPAG